MNIRELLYCFDIMVWALLAKFLYSLFRIGFICIAIKMTTEQYAIARVWIPLTPGKLIKPDFIFNTSVKYDKCEEIRIRFDLYTFSLKDAQNVLVVSCSQISRQVSPESFC